MTMTFVDILVTLLVCLLPRFVLSDINHQWRQDVVVVEKSPPGTIVCNVKELALTLAPDNKTRANKHLLRFQIKSSASTATVASSGNGSKLSEENFKINETTGELATRRSLDRDRLCPGLELCSSQLDVQVEKVVALILNKAPLMQCQVYKQKTVFTNVNVSLQWSHQDHDYCNVMTFVLRYVITCCHLKTPQQVTPVEYFQVIGINITLLDVNDHAPTFPSNESRIFLSSNSRKGQLLQLPFALDPDEGRNGSVGYELVGLGNDTLNELDDFLSLEVGAA